MRRGAWGSPRRCRRHTAGCWRRRSARDMVTPTTARSSSSTIVLDLESELAMSGLSIADLTVLLVYLLGTTALGIWVGRRSRTVAEYFMPRKFSKPVMIMYAFGTGTASDQAVVVAAATFKNGLSGIWYQWLWLFATPFYWMIAPIMRRVPALTPAHRYPTPFQPRVAKPFAA